MNDTLVTVIGWVGQACFFSRFLIQWLASERARQSVAPRVFWWFSLVGAACLIVFTLDRGNTVFLVGFMLTLGIYARNLFFSEGGRRFLVERVEALAAHPERRLVAHVGERHRLRAAFY